MADVQPFRAVRFARLSDAVIAPPYDVVSPGERDVLLARDPHNIGHLTLAEDEDAAGDLYRDWLATGVLVRDEEPAVWVLEQDFVAPDGSPRQRRGIAASLGATTLPSTTGTPAARITILACSLCMANAEARTPEWG